MVNAVSECRWKNDSGGGGCIDGIFFGMRCDLYTEIDIHL